jgi:hypothetical protein
MGLNPFPRSSRAILSFVLLFGVGKSVCSAPQTPPEPNLAERRRLAEQLLHDKLPFWQKRLALESWNVSILSVRSSDLRPGTLGNIHWDKENKTAVIRALDAADYRRPLRATLDDLEFTVVHELIHLELVSLPRSEASRSDEEYAINNLADALLKFERAKAQTAR